MRITTRQDIAAPIAQVFAEVTDATAFERQALRRGAEVRRLDRLPALAVGSSWRVAFSFRGREREAAVAVTRLEAPTLVSATIESGGLHGATVAELLALSRTTTRLVLTFDLEATTLTSRLLLQTLKLARGSLERRAEGRVATWAREVEARWQRRAARR